MSDKKIKIQIADPGKLVYMGEAASVILPAHDGEMGVLHGHIPMIGLMGAGTVDVNYGTTREYFAVRSGQFEITGEAVKILAEEAGPVASKPGK